MLKEEGEFTPYAGVVYDITDDVSLYASYASIFNPNSPDTKDIAGDVLPPQVGDQYEIGAKAELFDGLNASLALFRIEQNNLAERDPAGTPGLCNGGDCYIATGLVVGQGVGVGASGEILPGWNIFGGYTYLDQRYAAGERDGERFRTETPNHLFKLLTTYEIPDTKWKVGGGVSYRSEIYAEGLNYQQGDIPWRIHQDGVFLVDLMAE